MNVSLSDKKSIDNAYIRMKEFDLVKKLMRRLLFGIVEIYDCSNINIMDDYKLYINRSTEVNTFAGVASFILDMLSMERLSK